MPRGTATRWKTRYAVRLTVPRRGGWRAWGTVRADFERALTDPVDPAIASAEMASELRRGADYVRVTIALTVAADVADALTIAWDAFRGAAPGGEHHCSRRYPDHDRAHSGFTERCPYRRGLRGMRAEVTVRIVKHAVNPGEKYGKLTIIREVRKVAPGGKSYRAVRCRCDCGNELTTALRSLVSGDARSCGCSRGRPKYEWRRCPVCGRRARIRRDRRSCSRACGHKLTGAALRAERPSYDVWHNRVKKVRGRAGDYRCIDCGGPAEDWSTADRSSDDVWVRFQPRCRKCHRRYDGAIGEGSPRAKLTAEKVRRLRARRADGLTYRQLAGEFGISDVSAHAAVNRTTWAHVA